MLSGAARIIVIDINAAKEELVRGCGATDFVATGDGTDPIEAIRELTAGVGADYAFDAVGDSGIESQLIASIAQFGTAVMVGFPRSGSTFEIDPAHIIRDEKTLTGSIFGSAHTHRDFVRFAELYAEGRLPLDRLITGRYSLEQVNDACKDMLTGVAGRNVLVF